MRRFISTLVTLVWGLWFGGLIAIFISVLSLFATFPRETAGQGAARIFHAFNAYQLALAALALIATFIWRLIGPPKRTTALFALFAVATLGACLVTMYFTPRIELLQHQGLAGSDQFKRLHGNSMIAYCGEVVVLLIAGLILPWTHESRL
jgi:hypothetical protein